MDDNLSHLIYKLVRASYVENSLFRLFNDTHYVRFTLVLLFCNEHRFVRGSATTEAIQKLLGDGVDAVHCIRFARSHHDRAHCKWHSFESLPACCRQRTHTIQSFMQHYYLQNYLLDWSKRYYIVSNVVTCFEVSFDTLI